MCSTVVGFWKNQPAWVNSHETTEYMDRISVRQISLKPKRSALSLAGETDRFGKVINTTTQSCSICYSILSITDWLPNTNQFLTKLNKVRGESA